MILEIISNNHLFVSKKFQLNTDPKGLRWFLCKAKHFFNQAWKIYYE